MELFTKCNRCGALMRPCDAKETAGGTRMRFWAAATTCTVDTDGGMALDLGGATVLCPDCMAQLKAWLASEPEEPQESADSVERLAAEERKERERGLAALLGAVEECSSCCEYFERSGRGGRTCPECPIYDYDDCTMGVLADIARRLRALGVGAGKTCAWGETVGNE